MSRWQVQQIVAAVQQPKTHEFWLKESQGHEAQCQQLCKGWLSEGNAVSG